MSIRAITFDFWRTLYREARSEERKEARAQVLSQTAGVPIETARETLSAVAKEFLRTHIAEQRTLSPGDATAMTERALGKSFNEEIRDRLTESFATAILDHPPEPLEQALEAVSAAAERYPVGLVSDTGVTPGSTLERLLERHGFRPHFRVLAFSDEVGVSKPQSPMFRHASEGLDVKPEEMLHIGDLEPTDVAGAIAFGAKAALFGGDNDRYVGATQAHYTFTSWAQFVEWMNGQD